MTDALVRTVNLRDIGGVAAAGGAIVRSRYAYRSAALTDLSGGLLAGVRALGIRSIVDLRRDDERRAHPTPWEAIGCTDYWGRPHRDSDADLTRGLGGGADAAERRATMMRLYADLPYAQAEAYGRLFRALAADAGPVLFHCAVGKDRTGVAAALILAALGVDRAAIARDYAATDAFDLLGSPHLRASALSPERVVALAPVLRADIAYLDTMFAAVDERSGGVDAYLRDTLALAKDEVAALGCAMLVPR